MGAGPKWRHTGTNIVRHISSSGPKLHLLMTFNHQNHSNVQLLMTRVLTSSYGRPSLMLNDQTQWRYTKCKIYASEFSLMSKLYFFDRYNFKEIICNRGVVKISTVLCLCVTPRFEFRNPHKFMRTPRKQPRHERASNTHTIAADSFSRVILRGRFFCLLGVVFSPYLRSILTSILFLAVMLMILYTYLC